MVALYNDHIKRLYTPHKEEFKQLIDPKGFEIVASKVDKISGDLRICFDIMKRTIENKIEKLGC